MTRKREKKIGKKSEWFKKLPNEVFLWTYVTCQWIIIQADKSWRVHYTFAASSHFLCDYKYLVIGNCFKYFRLLFFYRYSLEMRVFSFVLFQKEKVMLSIWTDVLLMHSANAMRKNRRWKHFSSFISQHYNSDIS